MIQNVTFGRISFVASTSVSAIGSVRFKGSTETPRRTLIVASLGPASKSPDVIRKMILAGADIFRIDFAKGTHEEHAATVENIRRVTKELEQSGLLKRPVRMMADLQGPRLAIGEVPEGKTLTTGDDVLLGTEEQAAVNPDVLPITYPDLVAALRKDNTLIVNDNDIVLKVKKPAVDGGPVLAEVVRGGTPRNGMVINAPDVKMHFPPLTPKDKEDLSFALANGFEVITQSFPASDKDVADTRKLIREQTDAEPMLIAKIERPQSVAPLMLRDIAREADALMVARGDLGTEMGLIALPGLQRRIIKTAHAEGKQVVVANKLLGSMVKNPQPSRSDVFDLEGAVQGGADMVMLTAETAAGQYPVEAVAMADAIIRESESEPKQNDNQPGAASNIYEEIATLVRQILDQVNQLVARIREVAQSITRR